MAETAAVKAKAPESSESVPVRREVSRRPAWPLLRDAALDRLFDDLFTDFDRGFRWPSLFRRRPALVDVPQLASMDVYETPEEVVVKAEMPGISKDEIEVTATGSTLTVKGAKKREEEVKEEDYYRCERSFGSIARTVELPGEVRAEKAVAKLTNGLLEVRLPKTEEAKAKSVKVKVD